MPRGRKKRQENTAIPMDANPTRKITQSLDCEAECEADETKAMNLTEKHDDGVEGSSSVQEVVKKKRGRKSKKEKEEMKKKKDVENLGENGGVSEKRRGRKRKRLNNEDEGKFEMPADSSGSGTQKQYILRGREVKEEVEKPKINKWDPKWIEEKSLMCHQCQRNDKGRVVRCTRCKRKRYPHLNEDDISKACPVCCGNCNCKACLRSDELI
ncbi:Lysine-specific demethylase JMJ25, partial [Mucuna pruriens]